MTDQSPTVKFDEFPTHSGQCTAKTRTTGQRCQRQAMHGTTVCYVHGGQLPVVQAANKRYKAQAAARRRLDIPDHVDPRDALAEELALTVAWVRWLSVQVNVIDDSAMIWGKTRSVDKLPIPEVTEEARSSMWWSMLIEQRKHLVDVARTAHACGVEDRRVQIMSEQADQLIAAMVGLVGELGRSVDDPMVRKAIAGQMRRMAAIETTGT